tara:strand:+ start:359 stop:478 length:120 start_codon:yes stop_codon:yes gene_type:complete
MLVCATLPVLTAVKVGPKKALLTGLQLLKKNNNKIKIVL